MRDIAVVIENAPRDALGEKSAILRFYLVRLRHFHSRRAGDGRSPTLRYMYERRATRAATSGKGDLIAVTRSETRSLGCKHLFGNKDERSGILQGIEMIKDMGTRGW